MSFIDVIIMLIYFGMIVFVGYLGSKRATTSEEYMVAGRNLGMFMYLGCLAAVILGGASTIGTARLGYEFGISGIWLVTMLGIGIATLGIFLAKKIAGLNVLTISQMLEVRYNKQTGLISAIVAAIYAMMVAVTQIIGIGTILNVLLEWNLTLSMLLGGGIVLFYTMLGGMWSVTMTDIIQFVVMTIGVFFIMFPMSLWKAGGFEALQTQLPESYLNIASIGGDRIFQYLLLFGLGMVVAQDIWQRIFTAKTIKIARQGTIYAGIYSLLYAIVVAIIGMCAFIVIPNLNSTQNTFAAMAITILPNGILGLVLAAVVSALMSTYSGTLLASSTLISNDIIKSFFMPNISEKQFLKVSRIITFLIGTLTIIFALWIQDVLVALDVAYAVLSGAVFFPIVLGFFWKRATAKAAFYSIISSTVVVLAGLAIEGITSTNPILYGMATSFIIIIVVSLLDFSNQKQVSTDEDLEKKKFA
ncbi:sodium:solute symporter [Ammoniphilus sp. YIM 78166]|uniref:sodium:solute symporter n=1 Tax=Ammoniphilus sp. YIM 78166 TaxID=1644106 RepID=UPI00106FD553|nr:sodium:solute symporter [Ammoniphilus sp. YIM 78166]